MTEEVVPPCMCGSDHRIVVHVYHQPPAGEVRFSATSGGYQRELRRCVDDDHVVSVHRMDLTGLYGGEYVDATYGPDGMRRTFERVLALPADRSDNEGRVARLLAFSASRWGSGRRRVLDVGSGTGVFPFRMAEAGWDVLASDPDGRAVAHLREVAGLDAITLDFTADPLDDVGPVDVLTFNKVLEHVLDPVAMLTRARALLASDGFVYVELPDADGAAADPLGFDREEFFIDHHHVFSPTSARLLAGAAGFTVVEDERVREPSSKYTLRLFLAVA